MSRVLRSRAIVIAEDQSTTSLPICTPVKTTDGRTPFEEIDNNEVAMTVDEVEMEQELKGLKALYKTTLNGKKKRKPRKAKKVHDDIHELEADEHADENEQLVTPTDSTQLSACEQFRDPTEGIQNAHETIVSQEPFVGIKATKNTPATSISRTTRQQLAEQQAQIIEESDLTEVEAPADQDVASSVGSDNVTSAQEHALQLPDVFGDKSSLEYTSAVMSPVKSLDDIERCIASPKTIGEPHHEILEDSFVEQIVSRSPAKTVSPSDEAVDEDSFVGDIITRSPAKRTSRISDSIEDLDKLEEALEALEEATQAQNVVSSTKISTTLPSATGTTATNTRHITKSVTKPSVPLFKSQSISRKSVHPTPAISTIKTQTLTRDIVKPTRHEPKMLITEKMSKHAPPGSVSSSSASPPDIRPTSSVAASSSSVSIVKKMPIKRPSSLLPPKLPVKSSKPPTVPSFELSGDAVARKLKEQREARLAGRPSSSQELPDSRRPASIVARQSVVIRSTKAPTTAKFELPGEALSRRKREAHEARLKAQEETDRKRREFKAKPVRTSIVPGTIPRDTLASLARKSSTDAKEENSSDRHALASSNGKCSSTMVGAQCASILASSQANVSAPRGPSRPASVANTARKVSATTMSGLTHKKQVSVSEQRTRAKEIYNRGMKSQEETEREKREKEERARKSREEAAERGREASRKWAEQMKAKLAKEDVGRGLEAGFGPGGQMGLKAA